MLKMQPDIKLKSHIDMLSTIRQSNFKVLGYADILLNLLWLSGKPDLRAYDKMSD